MRWICSAASEDSLSPARGSASAPSPSARSNPSAEPSSQSIGPMSPATTTSEHSTPSLFGDESISSAAASPARTYPPQGRVPGSEEHAPVCGKKWRESSPEYARCGSSLRTCLLRALEELTGFSLTWKRSATTHGRSWWVLGRSARRTGEIASGSSLDWRSTTAEEAGPRLETLTAKDGSAPKLGHRIYRSGGPHQSVTLGLQAQIERAWMTPNTMDALAPKSQEALDHEHDSARPGRSAPNNLRDQLMVQEGERSWPPRTWATPTVQDSENLAGPSQFGRNSEPLNVQVVTAGPPAQENPSTNGRSRDSWRTPQAADGTHNHGEAPAHQRGTVALPLTVQTRRSESTSRGQLNSRWVAQLMGFPSDWCELDDATIEKLSKRTATQFAGRSRKRS